MKDEKLYCYYSNRIDKLSPSIWDSLAHRYASENSPSPAQFSGSRICIIFSFHFLIDSHGDFSSLNMPNTSRTRFFVYFFHVTQNDCSNVRLHSPYLFTRCCSEWQKRLSLQLSRRYVIVNQQSLMNLLIEAQSMRQKLNKVLNFYVFAAKLPHESSER